MSVGPNRILGDKYRLIRPLDGGGPGSVWLAEHLSLAAPVAVKVIRAPALSESRLSRFEREARAAAAARSPHVVQILDYGVDAGTPFIVMELLEGESLATRLARLGRLGPEQTETIVRQVSRALSRAHESGIVHRDLKPSNIFIARNGDEEIVKLLDFGISRDATNEPDPRRPQRTTSLHGTPSYMSPEQLEGSPLCDHRTDVWALGVIAFECLLGRLPFAGKGIGGLVLGVCSGPVPVPSEHGSVPAAFDAWFRRACARDLAERFDSAREAAAAWRSSVEPAQPDEPYGAQLDELYGAQLDAALDTAPAPAPHELAAAEAVHGEPPARAGVEGASSSPASSGGTVDVDAAVWPAPSAARAEPASSAAPSPEPAPPSAGRNPDALPTTTAPPSSATLERRPERPRTRPIWLVAPLVSSVLGALLLHEWRSPPAISSNEVLQPLALPVAPPAELAPPLDATLVASGKGVDLQLSIDGAPLGPLPRTVQGLAPGEHSVLVSGGPRYHPYEARLQLAPGQVAELGPVELEVAKGLATIVAGENAAGARLVLKLGDEELALPALPVQLEVNTSTPHTLLARKRGYETFSAPLTFEAGQADRTFTVSLEKSPSRSPARATKPKRARRGRSAAPRPTAADEVTSPPTFSFRATPEASVLLDGTPLGTTPLLDVPVEPGSHRVIFIHDGQRKAMVVTGTPGKNRVVSTRFRASGPAR